MQFPVGTFAGVVQTRVNPYRLPRTVSEALSDVRNVFMDRVRVSVIWEPTPYGGSS
jgi:hypothetical protein